MELLRVALSLSLFEMLQLESPSLELVVDLTLLALKVVQLLPVILDGIELLLELSPRISAFTVFV